MAQKTVNSTDDRLAAIAGKISLQSLRGPAKLKAMRSIFDHLKAYGDSNVLAALEEAARLLCLDSKKKPVISPEGFQQLVERALERQAREDFGKNSRGQDAPAAILPEKQLDAALKAALGKLVLYDDSGSALKGAGKPLYLRGLFRRLNAEYPPERIIEAFSAASASFTRQQTATSRVLMSTFESRVSGMLREQEGTPAPPASSAKGGQSPAAMPEAGAQAASSAKQPGKPATERLPGRPEKAHKPAPDNPTVSDYELKKQRIAQTLGMATEAVAWIINRVARQAYGNESRETKEKVAELFLQEAQRMESEGADSSQVFQMLLAKAKRA